MKTIRQNPVLLSLGGNLGNTAEHFASAERLLEQGGFVIRKISSLHRSPAVNCESGAADFLNVSILGEWNGTPEDLIALTQNIEEKEGRPNDHPKGFSRTLDIDIILMGELVSGTARLTLPHPRLAGRGFVLIPSAEIAPDLSVPGTGLDVRGLLERLPPGTP